MMPAENHDGPLEDVKVHVRFKLSALWISAMFCYVYGDFFSLFEPGRIEGMAAGKMGIGSTTPVKLLAGAIVMTVPSVMVFLSVALPSRLSRWLNIAFGTIYSLMMLLISVRSLVVWKMFYVYFGLTEVLITMLIVRYALSWPKHAAVARTIVCVAVLGTFVPSVCRAQADSKGGNAPKLERMPASLETRFALSAAPPPVREHATVYLLDPSTGYVLGRAGTNGVSCIVVRSDWQWASPPFRDDIYWPVCYDAEGSRTLLQDYLYAAELRARGTSSEAVHKAVTERFGTTAFPNPARTGVAYMIAPIMRGYTSGPQPVTMNMPHYMFYAPGVRDADIAGHGFSKEHPFILGMSRGRDDYIIQLVGVAEKAHILRESRGLLDGLCSYRKYLCTTAETRARTPVQ